MARSIIDLGTGPLVFGRGARRPHLREIFLRSPFPEKGYQSHQRQLDDFATTIVTEEGFDGVYCLTGVRGSGKSTVLNRVEAECARLAELRRLGPTPLLVRIDMSASFEPAQFAADFAKQISAAAQNHYEDGGAPHDRLPRLTFLVGLVARWCQANLAWACAFLCVIAVLIGVSQMYEGSRDAAQAESEVRVAELRLKQAERQLAALRREPDAPDVEARQPVLEAEARLALAIDKLELATSPEERSASQGAGIAPSLSPPTQGWKWSPGTGST